MSRKNEEFEMLLVESNETIIDFFKVLTKKFDMQVKYATNTNEFVDLVKIYNFQNIICDIDLSYRLEGIFISNVYNNIKNIRHIDGKMYLLSDRTVPNLREGKFKFDGVISKKFQEIYDFLVQNYDFKSYYKFIDQIASLESAVSM